jgi:hypothetical protein
MHCKQEEQRAAFQWTALSASARGSQVQRAYACGGFAAFFLGFQPGVMGEEDRSRAGSENDFKIVAFWIRLAGWP